MKYLEVFNTNLKNRGKAVEFRLNLKLPQLTVFSLHLLSFVSNDIDNS